MFAVVLNAKLIEALNASPLKAAIQQDHALQISLQGDLTGGPVQIDIPHTNLYEVDAVLENGLTIPLVAGVQDNEPIFLKSIKGHVTFTGTMGLYTYSITLC